MKLATFTDSAGTRIGVVDGDDMIDLSVADAALPGDMLGLIDAGPDALASVAVAVASGQGRLPLSSVRLEPPIPRPGKFLAVGLNYQEHIAEMNATRLEHPNVFVKLNTCLNGPFDEVHRPLDTDSLDYEGELGFVIGRRCRRVPADQAAHVIFGYVVVNDISVREWQRRATQVTLSKSLDTAGPFGPWITTADEVGDPQDLDIKTWVNGELRQSSNTADMLFGVYDLVSRLSQGTTLEPGDVVTAGSPPGVGDAMTPPRYLQPGNIVKVEIESLGAIENTVIAEPDQDL